MVGALTDQCVESAIRDACDDSAPQPPPDSRVMAVGVACAIVARVRDQQPCRSQVPRSTRVVLALVVRKGDDKSKHAFVAVWPGFLVTQATDACVTFSKERHETSISAIKGYCRQRTTAELLREVRPLGSASAGQCRLA